MIPCTFSHNQSIRTTAFLRLAFLACACFSVISSARAADVIVYDDAFAAGWDNWSWNETAINFDSAAPVHSGAKAALVTYTQGYAGVKLHAPAAIDTAGLASVRFWAHGGAVGGQPVIFQVYDAADAPVGAGHELALVAGAWQEVNLTIAELGSPAAITSLVWFESSATAVPSFSLDDITLVGLAATPTPVATATPGAGIALSVDAAAGKHAISPLIYGMNLDWPSAALATELRLPVRRWGGNTTTRYNWQNDTSNHARDYFYENLPEDNADPDSLPNGSTTDRFVERDRATGTKTIISVPLIGWTPKSRALSCGFSVAAYGPQFSVDPFQPNCGDGIHVDGVTPVVGNNPLDTSIAIGPSFIADWVAHLVGRYGTAANGGVAFYALDNEPELWNDTHRDVHPAPLTYDEQRDLGLQYGAAIKAIDPTAQVIGPEPFGWPAYFWSALDAGADHQYANRVDHAAHGNVDLIPWYLQQMRDYEIANGTRILDYLDIHYYTEAAGVTLSCAGDAATQTRRLRCTRSLWDPTYVDESYINEPVRLIPRMREWVQANYPGTKISISEYSWGALEDINGALAQADVLGIFGREGLDMATLWVQPQGEDCPLGNFSTLPAVFAYRLYRNYDGAGGAFGADGVSATSADQAKLAIYAATRSADGALTLMIVNKSGAAQTASVALSNFTPAAAASVYRYSPANLGAIAHLADQPVGPGGFDMPAPVNSITLVVVAPAGDQPTATATQTATATPTLTPSPTPTPNTLRGDVWPIPAGDGQLTIEDQQTIVAYIVGLTQEGSNEWRTRLDVNADGAIDAADFVEIGILLGQ